MWVISLQAVIFSKGETLDIKVRRFTLLFLRHSKCRWEDLTVSSSSLLQVSYHPRLTGSERNTFRDFRGVGREFVPAQAVSAYRVGQEGGETR